MENQESAENTPATTPAPEKTIGCIAYDAYCKSVGGKSIRGEQLPSFDNQNENIQEAWEVAACSVAITIVETVRTGLSQLINVIIEGDPE